MIREQYTVDKHWSRSEISGAEVAEKDKVVQHHPVSYTRLNPGLNGA